jgi:conjugal transfer pilus assembly protein TraF
MLKIAARSALTLGALLLVSTVCCSAGAEQQTPAKGSDARARPAVVAQAGGQVGGESKYWTRSREGWFWYEDPPAPVPAPEPAPVTPPAPKPLPIDDLDKDLDAFKLFQQRLERSLNAATQNPSEANVARFLELWAQARNKASMFTDVAQAVAVRMPWVDETAQGTRPTNPVAQRVFDQERKVEQEALMRSLSTTHGLYFFYRSDCPYCHAQAPMLKQLEVAFGFTVFAVSMDGGPMPGFPRAVRDNGLAAQVAQAIGMPAEQLQVPFTVLARPSTREVLPIGFGTMTAAEMVERIALVVRMRNEAAAANGQVASIPQPQSLLRSASAAALR